MSSYGYSIHWSDIQGSWYCVSVDGCPSIAMAHIRCVMAAHGCGWRPRRWWQFWRWCDTPNWQILDA